MSAVVRRVASRIRLRPEKRELYLQLHAAAWPEVLATLTSVGIRNYSIFLEGDDLFSYYEFEGDDLDAAHRTIAEDPSTQAWWRLTDPCQERLPGTPDGQQWLDMVEVFHHR